MNKTISAAAPNSRLSTPMPFCAELPGRRLRKRLDNRMLQETVRETVVPVLEEWLSHYLPKLVAEEVKRVMVKAGGTLTENFPSAPASLFAAHEAVKTLRAVCVFSDEIC